MLSAELNTEFWTRKGLKEDNSLSQAKPCVSQAKR